MKPIYYIEMRWFLLLLAISVIGSTPPTLSKEVQSELVEISYGRRLNV